MPTIKSTAKPLNPEEEKEEEIREEIVEEVERARGMGGGS